MKRTHQVNIRLNDKELAKLQKIAGKMSLCLSEALRELIRRAK